MLSPNGHHGKSFLSRWGDQWLIDNGAVHGLGRVFNWVSSQSKVLQTGKVYHYAFVMVTFSLVFVLSLMMFR